LEKPVAPLGRFGLSAFLPVLLNALIEMQSAAQHGAAFRCLNVHRTMKRSGAVVLIERLFVPKRKTG
jgi:hypothetical protein